MATVLNAIGLVVNGILVLTAARIGNGFVNPERCPASWPRCLLASVYAGLACKLALGGRQ
ncbi:hypothetical protein [Sodalis sp. (in: enterobacteria)]|uniref:hypothetical protein n=1 Tax=Sodalis sp. (in: enterobacteria) TaxID=1898979 RepID=UPI003F6889BF